MSVLETAIGWLAPPLCVNCGEESASLCAGCSELVSFFGERCWRCNKLSPLSRTCDSCRHTASPSRVFIRSGYSGLVRELLGAYKFHHQRQAAPVIANLMLEQMPAPADYLIVPVPTATNRLRERGFDHTSLLAKQISLKLDLPYANSLRRLGQSRQLGSRREDRLTQLAGSFIVKSPSNIKGQSILLVDDVVTTGGTIITAAKALRQAGAARVDALIFAKRL